MSIVGAVLGLGISLTIVGTISLFIVLVTSPFGDYSSRKFDNTLQLYILCSVLLIVGITLIGLAEG